MISTKIMPDGRVTIPLEVRDALCLAPGDTIIFNIVGRLVTISRESIPEDPFHLFDEWAGDEDSKGYKDF